ncbi:hypothetical protein BS78_09G115700 [Paspalum vaginatum]|nr:hypothetical protein BS78_09G115700 [Paspalum vaginatum]
MQLSTFGLPFRARLIIEPNAAICDQLKVHSYVRSLLVQTVYLIFGPYFSLTECLRVHEQPVLNWLSIAYGTLLYLLLAGAARTCKKATGQLFACSVRGA